MLSQNKNQHPILNPCVNTELNSLRNKEVRENHIFDRTSGLKLEMTSYSDNTYDVTNFVTLKSSWSILYSHQV